MVNFLRKIGQLEASKVQAPDYFGITAWNHSEVRYQPSQFILANHAFLHLDEGRPTRSHLSISRPSMSLSYELSRLVRHFCPECEKLIGIATPDLDGNLGPTLYQCEHCEADLESGSREWARFSKAERKNYVRRSTLYAIGVGLLFTLPICGGLAATGNLTTHRPVAFVGSAFVLIAGTVAALQGWRVFGSLQRDGHGDLQASSASLKSFESNVLIRLSIPFAVAVAIFVYGCVR